MTTTVPSYRDASGTGKPGVGVMVLNPDGSSSADQDPIFDTIHGTRTPVTTSTLVLTPPAECRYAIIDSNVTIFVNTANAAAVDDGTTIRVFADIPQMVPVEAGVAVYALSSAGSAIVRCMPLKVR